MSNGRLNLAKGVLLVATRSTPEARALLLILLVVLGSATLRTVIQAFERIDAAEARARYATNASEELRKKVDELETQVEELGEQVSQLQ
jgi:uncharacterized membrane protein YidH (DUF202 family)